MSNICDIVYLSIMKNLDKYHYICSNCNTEWYSNKKIKKLKIIQKHRKQDPVNFDLQENIIKNLDGTIKTVELKVIEIKNKTEELIGRYNRYNLKLDKCSKCIIDKEEADSFRKKNKLKEIGIEKETKIVNGEFKNGTG